jgi:hypothetical protein
MSIAWWHRFSAPTVRDNLATAYQDAGRLDEAESLRNRVEPRS